jgi:uncharacterized protein YegL
VTQPLYFLADTSGSTVRDGVNAGWNLVLPEIVSYLETTCPDRPLSMLSYGSDARLRVPLTPVRDVMALPWMPPHGLGSLAAGLRLLGSVAGDDHRQLAADGAAPGRPLVVVIADDLPTDDATDLLAARDGLTVDLHLVVPAGVDALALAGLRASVYPLRVGDPRAVADSILAVVRKVVASLDR